MRIIFIVIALISFLKVSVRAQLMEPVKIKTPHGILKIEANLKWHTLRVRAETSIPGENGAIAEADLLKLIEKLVTEKDSLLYGQTFSSLYLGRLVEYPWLVTFLMRRAAESPEWQAERGRLKIDSVNINDWVATILFTHPIRDKIDRLFRKSGYRVTGISVEKVLVNDASKVERESVKYLTGKLPFDAQTWLILKKIK
ncbi:hypothetical protein [Caldithrix abyssi]